MLRATALRKTFDEAVAVSDIDIRFDRGEVVALLGPSGSGKSTVFNLLAGVLRPDAGRIFLNQRDITQAGVDVRARLGMGYVPQSPDLFADLTVEENLRIAVEARNETPDRADRFLAAIATAFGFEDIRHQRLANLSGGQRRRVEVVFAVCGRPRYLLLDEPFVGLDPIFQDRLSSDIMRLAKLGIGILVTDHNVRQALTLARRSYVIDRGVIIAAGSSGDIVRDRKVKTTFLGERFGL